MKKKILYGGGSDNNLVFFYFLKICREKMYQVFDKEISNLTIINKILDVGTSPVADQYQNYLINKYPYKRKIICASNVKLNKIKKKYPEIKTIQCDGRKLPLNDNYVDTVISNATIEHVGNKKKQIKFIKEALRVSKKLIFISTPNRYFPIDFHTLIPFLHFLPKKIHRFILKMIGFKFLSKERNLNLLSTNDLKNICSILNIKNYAIKKIKLLGFCTNLILIIYK